MKIRIKPKKLIVPVLNAAAIVGIIVTSVIGSASANALQYNFTADKWKGESSQDFSQLSCFFNADSGFDTSRIRSVKGQFLSELKDVAYDTEDRDRLLIDAYSAIIGDSKVTCDIARRSNAQITAVGGNFFYFHDLKLVSGSYFTEKDTMQDGAVIDRSLAWALYGSDDIAGKNIYIDGVKCYIAGVVQDPENKAEKKCAGKVPKAYVTYETADRMMEYSSKAESTKFSTITDYECVLPEPVENFGINAVKKVFSATYGENVSIVENTKRFAPKKRAKAFKKLSESVIRNDGIRLPYWENASRMYEFRASVCYGIRRYLFIIPILTFLWLVFKLILAYNNNKKQIKSRICSFIINGLQKLKPKKKGKTS